jgi:chemotaxis signal transduction protein
MEEQKQITFTSQEILEQRARRLAKKPEVEQIGETIHILIIALDQERYGLPVADIMEIQPLTIFTPVPGVSTYWLGLFNLRSTLVPLLDLRAYLGLTAFPINPSKGDSRQNRQINNWDGQIIIAQKDGNPVGLLVDFVLETRKILLTEIKAPLENLPKDQKNVVCGLTSEMITILNIQNLLGDPALTINHHK